MGFENDKRTVLTLDAGGTNFVFSAIRGNNEIVKPVTFPSNANDLDLCLGTIIKGFQTIISYLDDKPVAISFAFPGPADYSRGIIGDLGNLPAFRGGVALGKMLENTFHLPVFINNDGDLFAFGEAISGFLTDVNNKLEDSGSPKRYKNLFGITLGTGFGAGLVHKGELFSGDNDAPAEIWVMRNKIHNSAFAEEGASIRAVQMVYRDKTSYSGSGELSPKDIYDIAKGKREGDKQAATEAFRQLGEVVGDALANAVTLVDGLIVIGGGLSNAYDLFIKAIINEMNGTIGTIDGKQISRLEMIAFDLEDENDMRLFLRGGTREITVPHSNEKLLYDPVKRVGVGLSRLGTSKAVSIGAYAYALNNIDKLNK